MRKTQHEKILECLRNPLNQDKDRWVALPIILDLHIAQYGTRTKELREGKTANKKSYNIENKTQWIGGERHSWFRLARNVEEQVELGFMGGRR